MPKCIACSSNGLTQNSPSSFGAFCTSALTPSCAAPPRLTFPLHAHRKAFLVPAVLASVSLSLVNQAVFIIPAGVCQVLPHRSLEKAFATLTTVYPIMFTWGGTGGKERKKTRGHNRTNVSMPHFLYMTSPTMH